MVVRLTPHNPPSDRKVVHDGWLYRLRLAWERRKLAASEWWYVCRRPRKLPLCARCGAIYEGECQCETLAKHMSFFVPAGFWLMERAEVDRIQNEAEARRIERDSARSALELILAPHGQDVSERIRDIAESALGRVP